MKVSKEAAARNRASLLKAGVRLIQERGFDGASVAEISKEAGLTEGAFYSQFPSKSALAAEACRLGQSERYAAMKAVHGTTEDDLKAYLDLYLSTAHQNAIGGGCPMAAYAAEICRQDAAVQTPFAEGFHWVVDLIETALADHTRPKAARERALLIVSAMIGSLTMARAVRGTAPGLSKEILAAARNGLTQLAGLPTAKSAPARVRNSKAVKAT